VFVARGNSFAAQPGDTDDLVMSMIIAVRMINFISTFEDDVFDVVNQDLRADGEQDLRNTEPFDEYDDPMPIGLL